MVAVRKKKYESGEAVNFVSRKQALRKLQLNLKDFRRLCILKGIHPREPRNRKRAQKGDLTKVQTMYHEKDVRFLLHEPIVWKFRDFKVFLKKLKKARAKGNAGDIQRIKSNKPRYSLDHIVRERYPAFIDAVRDLEDCLCLCFLYSTFPKNPKTPIEMITLCRRLCVEFMHYVIESRSLRKVFVSIKGYYYQAEIMGQLVTWVVPHSFAYENPRDVDFRLMSIFVEFYTTMLGFVNYRLYHNLNLLYPPTLEGAVNTKTIANKEGEEEGKELVDNDDGDGSSSDIVAALNRCLKRSVTEADDDAVEIDNIPTYMESGVSNEEAREKLEKLKKFQNLFKNVKIYLNREVPREPLVFMLRAFGGQVSWDANVAPGATFSEDEPTITHQICDRPRESIQLKHIGRDYVQPQWVFDCINREQSVPTHPYFVGEDLPPHLSPFIKEERRIGDYIPPEEKALLGFIPEVAEEKGSEEDSDQQNSDEASSSEKEDSEPEEGDNKMEEVRVGKPEDVQIKAKEEELMGKEQFRLREMMVKRKHRGLYKSMMRARKRRVHESKQLEYKRKLHDTSKMGKPAQPKSAVAAAVKK